MAGIYIHIPFCTTRCIYCDFYSDTNTEQINAFVDALCHEAEIRKDEIHEPIQTIYFGGGTPSQLDVAHLEKIFRTIYNCFNIDTNPEITIEANPDDLSINYIAALAALPFNRISIGIQSFDDNELKFLSRRHSAQAAIAAVKNCQKRGFENISIDLMYGLPRQTMKMWRKNLHNAINLNIQHISAYHLIYEEQTRIFFLLQAGKIAPLNEELSLAMFSTLIEELTKVNFTHYEISNFAKQNFISRHNSSYWKGEKYIGLGPSAHSFDGEARSCNSPSIAGYIFATQQDSLPQEKEYLSMNDKYNEYILTGLRTMWGINLRQIKNSFGNARHQFCMANAQKYIDNGLLAMDESQTLKLTRDGIFISDSIMSDLMWID